MLLTKQSKFFLYAITAIIAVAAFYYFSDSSRGLSLYFEAPDKVSIGAPFDLKVGFSNQSKNVLEDAKMSLTLPEGAVFVGSNESKLKESRNLGSIGEGSLISETYNIVFLKGENSAAKIKASVTYTSSSLSTHFEKTKEYEIAVGESGISVDLAVSEEILSGEEFETEVAYKNVSEADFSNLELKIEYPANFSFKNSSLKPDKANNVWVLGDLRKGSEGSFSFNGEIIGPENSTFSFKTEMKMTLGGQTYVFNTKETQLMISPSAISFNIILNDKQEDYISGLGDELNYVLSYVNNTDVPLRNVVIRAQLVGELFDFNYLETNASLRRSDNTLIWNPDNLSELNYLAPKSAGVVKFKILTKEGFPINRWSDKNFTLKVNAEIESPTIPGTAKTSKTFGIAKMDTKVKGNAEVEAKILFRDADSKILNKGSLPLKVGIPTNLTVHWLLKNYAVDSSNVEIRAQLANGVKFTGTTKSDFGTAPFYDDKTNQMVWQISSIPANKGVIDDPAEAIFQIEVTPSASQVGTYMALLGETSIKATDNFTSLEMSGFMSPMDSSLSGDPTVSSQDGVVQP
ncbi:MAG: hypothetical protein PHP03_00020 [Candidatus Pacebacteria bacterium]|nr:hypothetical protein [Candidatus Paceibacterota bacterium]